MHIQTQFTACTCKDIHSEMLWQPGPTLMLGTSPMVAISNPFPPLCDLVYWKLAVQSCPNC